MQPEGHPERCPQERRRRRRRGARSDQGAPEVTSPRLADRGGDDGQADENRDDQRPPPRVGTEGASLLLPAEGRQPRQRVVRHVTDPAQQVGHDEQAEPGGVDAPGVLDHLGNQCGHASEDEAEGGHRCGVQEGVLGRDVDGHETEEQGSGGQDQGSGGDEDRRDDRRTAADATREQHLESTVLLVLARHPRDDADPHQGDRERGKEAELVGDDPAKGVQPDDVTVDRDECVAAADRVGVGVDLRLGVVEPADRARRRDHGGRQREHPRQERLPSGPELDRQRRREGCCVHRSLPSSS